MALLKVICWAVIFIARIRFPPGKSLVSIVINVNVYLPEMICRLRLPTRRMGSNKHA